jgi:aspartate carbamoyltransferase catalytic subunit
MGRGDMHVLAAEQFETERMEVLFKETDSLREQDESGREARRELAGRYIGAQCCSLFYEPSTRTRLSFETAAAKFGMGVVSTENAREFSSAAKGETIEDTIQVLNQYNLDIIVMRHHETGAADKAAAVSEVPIFNAGDGKGEHPTQALLDTYTIHENFGRLDNLRIVMGGDLANGRTVRSLAQLMSRYGGNHITFVSTPELQIGEDIKTKLRERGTKFDETADMYEALRDADVVYWTRLQKERLENPEAVPEGGFTLDQTALEVMPKEAMIMHPLPRVGEITQDVDSDPRARYFRQAGNGLYIRMALIDEALKNSL